MAALSFRVESAGMSISQLLRRKSLVGGCRCRVGTVGRVEQLETGLQASREGLQGTTRYQRQGDRVDFTRRSLVGNV